MEIVSNHNFEQISKDNDENNSLKFESYVKQWLKKLKFPLISLEYFIIIFPLLAQKNRKEVKYIIMSLMNK